MKKMNTMLLSSLVLIVASTAGASDCGYGALSAEDQQILSQGKSVLKSDFSKGIESFTIDQFELINSTSVFDSAAHFYNIANYPDVSIVEKTTLSEGEQASNNPVKLDVTPKDENPFGNLYQPFTYQVSTRAEGLSYIINIDYLTSPVLIHDLQSEICFVKKEDQVFMSYRTHFQGNPKIGLQTPGFGINERTALWKAVFKSAKERSILPQSEIDNTTFEKALLGQGHN